MLRNAQWGNGRASVSILQLCGSRILIVRFLPRPYIRLPNSRQLTMVYSRVTISLCRLRFLHPSILLNWASSCLKSLIIYCAAIVNYSCGGLLGLISNDINHCCSMSVLYFIQARIVSMNCVALGPAFRNIRVADFSRSDTTSRFTLLSFVLDQLLCSL